MKKKILATILFGYGIAVLATEVGVSVSVGQPGFYGQINIGSFPRPQLLYPEPVSIQRPPNSNHSPIYLHVPPGHAKHWEKHCRQYNACGRPVYFVQENWYNEVYVPHYQEHHSKGARQHDYGRDQREYRGHDEGRAHEQGKGRGKGHGKHQD